MNSKYSGIRPTTRRTCETNVSEDHPALEWPDTTSVPLWAARLWSVSQACATLRKSETCWAPGGGRGGASGWGVVRGGALAPGASRRGGASAGGGGGAAGPGAGSGRARVRRRGPGGGRVLGCVSVCARARAQAAGGAPRGRRGAGGGRRAWGRGRGSETRRANGAGSCGTRGERRAQARSLAPAPWTRTTATVSTALGPAGGRPLPRFLPAPARRLGRASGDSRFPGTGAGREPGGAGRGPPQGRGHRRPGVLKAEGR